MQHQAFLSSLSLIRGRTNETTTLQRTCTVSPRWTCSAKPIFSRRTALKLALALAALQTNKPTFAAEKATTDTVSLGPVETDEAHGYTFRAPPIGWTRSIATLSSFRTATVFVCDEDSDSNISMIATSVPGDYQKLTSFGTLDNVLNTMVPKGKEVDGEVLSTRTDPRNNAYFIEYTVTSKGVKRHLLTVFSLQPGQYLLTLTGQSKEENWSLREPVFRAVANSYSLITRA